MLASNAVNEVSSFNKGAPQSFTQFSHLSHPACNPPLFFPSPSSRRVGIVSLEAFETCRPYERIVLAVLQHLLFIGKKVTNAAIAEMTGLSVGGVKNALSRLRKLSFIKKEKGGYLFLCRKIDGSMEFEKADKVTEKSLYYFLKISHITDQDLNNMEVCVLAYFHKATKAGRCPAQCSIDAIAEDLKISGDYASTLLKSLVQKKFLSRKIKGFREAYIYRMEAKGMGIYPEDFSTEKEKGNPAAGIKGNPAAGTILNRVVFTNSYKPDSSNTHQQTADALLRDPFLQKEMQEVVLPYTEKLARSLPRLSENVELELKAKTAEHTEALAARTKELRENKRVSKETANHISKLEVDLSLIERKKQKIEYGLNVWLSYTTNPMAMLSKRLVPLDAEEIKMLEGTVRALTPKFSTESQDKMAFCLLFNSLMKDIAELYKKTYHENDNGAKAKRYAVNNSLRCIKSQGYELNVAIYPESKKRLNNDK